ncbi:hypothetical protein BA190_21915 [Labrys sp. WJW]|nr:hypothetical protein BA190_21915 [Labrys sp. WJW]
MIAIIIAAIIAGIAVRGAIGVTTFRRDAACQGQSKQAGKHEYLLHGHDSLIHYGSWLDNEGAAASLQPDVWHQGRQTAGRYGMLTEANLRLRARAGGGMVRPVLECAP